MAKHSKIGASSMHRWANCPGSVRLSEGLESPSSSYAEEGTKAHEIAAHKLQYGYWPDGELDQEMVEAVEVYVEEVEKDRAVLRNRYSTDNKFLVEHKFDLSEIHPGLFGTSDCVIYQARNKTLIVYDYKHGKGIAVEVEGNEQLKYYALGALLSIKKPAIKVTLKIVQPRCDHADGVVRSWSFDSLDLLDFAADLKDAAAKTEEPNAALVPGEWCRFCPAAGICPTLHSKALTTAKAEFLPQENYDPKKLADTLDALPQVEAFVSQVREFAYREAMKGRVPPGYKLIAKRGTRKWKADEETTAEALECILPDQECYWERKLKSPAQVEKLTGKGQIDDLVKFESSGFKLAHVSEPGEPIKLDAKTEFSEIE